MNIRINMVIGCLLMVAMLQPVAALELFGVNLESTNRDELREAAKRAGVILIRQGSSDIWFDVYDSSTVLTGSRRLYLGFVKQDRRFAFAEYEFAGIHLTRLLNRLTQKYGSATKIKGSFVSDHRYRWQRDGIEIELSSDWQAYSTRLSYTDPANMPDLISERAKGIEDNEENPVISVF